MTQNSKILNLLGLRIRQPGGLADSSRWLKRSENLRNKPPIFSQPSGLHLSHTKLEAEATLNLNYPSRESALGLPEECVLHLCAWAVEIEWLQIQDIKDVEEICLYFEEFSFTEEVTQTEPLTDSHVDVEVSWAAERVSADARQLESNRRRGAEEG